MRRGRYLEHLSFTGRLFCLHLPGGKIYTEVLRKKLDFPATTKFWNLYVLAPKTSSADDYFLMRAKVQAVFLDVSISNFP